MPRTFSAVLPLQTRSVLNLREHWSARHKRTSSERYFTGLICAGIKRLKLPATITLTRVAPSRCKPMDSDNLLASNKAIRDALAELLGIDDSDHGSAPPIVWRYEQRIEGKEYAVEVRAETRDA